MTVLTPQQRRVLELYEYHGEYASAAGAMGVSVRTVKFHLQGARERLGAVTSKQAVMTARQRGFLGEPVIWRGRNAA